MTDYRERLERVRLEAEHQRNQDRIEQGSILLSSDARVRVWERLHRLRLPDDPVHPILAHIAVSTSLTLEEVQDVQRTRIGARVPK